MIEGTYLVGLPVIVTIGADGRVTLDVCAEDLSEAMRQDDNPTDEHIAAAEAFLLGGTMVATVPR